MANLVPYESPLVPTGTVTREKPANAFARFRVSHTCIDLISIATGMDDYARRARQFLAHVQETVKRIREEGREFGSVRPSITDLSFIVNSGSYCTPGQRLYVVQMTAPINSKFRIRVSETTDEWSFQVDGAIEPVAPTTPARYIPPANYRENQHRYKPGMTIETVLPVAEEIHEPEDNRFLDL